MKRIHFVKLLLVAVLVGGSLNAWGETEELTSEELKTNVTNTTCAYNTAKSYTDGTISYTFNVYTDATDRPWVQMKKDKGVFVKIESPTNTSISSVVVVITSASNSSGGISDISKHTAFSGTVALHTADTTGAANMKGVATTTSISSNKATLSPNGNNNTLYLKVSAGARIWGITVTYSSSGSTETTPSITLQPESATYNQGATATALTITAGGNPAPTYQWYSNTSNSNTNGTKISGATEASCTPSTATAGTFYYYCVATNSKGSATSDVATITVNAVYTVTWVVGSNSSKTQSYTTQVASGSKATPPDDLTLTGNEIGDCANTFMGWTIAPITSPQDTPPTVLFKNESPDAITANTTFYAVFARPK